MPVEKPIHSFNFVPGGATLEVWTTGTSDDFTTIVKLRSTAGDAADWEHDDLFREQNASTKKTQPLISPRRYHVLYTTAFASEEDTEAKMHARVVEGPDQTQIRRHTWTLEGKRKHSEFVVLRIGTSMPKA